MRFTYSKLIPREESNYMSFPSLVVINVIRIHVQMNNNNKNYTLVHYLIIMAEMKPHFAKVIYLYC